MMCLVEDWEYNVLGVYNYRKPGPLEHYFEFIIENHVVISGDICEAGVYRGRSLLATALLLRELGSAKIVWGFDTFAGFPAYHANDDLSKFTQLYEQGVIDDALLAKVKHNQELRMLEVQDPLSVANISTSGAFARTSLEVLQCKINHLQLNNIRLMCGIFDETMQGDYPPFMAALMDCDLYLSYKTALPFIWKHLSRGGYIFLDEYYSLKFPGARIATDEFYADKRDKPQMHRQIAGDFQRWFVRKIFED
jgi:hypothetical protein